MTRITFIGGPGNTLAQGDWYTNEGQRLEFPLRIPVDIDLASMSDLDRRFAETVIRKIKAMPQAYTVEERASDQPSPNAPPSDPYPPPHPPPRDPLPHERHPPGDVPDANGGDDGGDDEQEQRKPRAASKPKPTRRKK